MRPLALFHFANMSSRGAAVFLIITPHRHLNNDDQAMSPVAHLVVVQLVRLSQEGDCCSGFLAARLIALAAVSKHHHRAAGGAASRLLVCDMPTPSCACGLQQQLVHRSPQLWPSGVPPLPALCREMAEATLHDTRLHMNWQEARIAELDAQDGMQTARRQASDSETCTHGMHLGWGAAQVNSPGPS